MKELKIRIVLDTEKDVFRDILIPDSYTFEQLHYSILDAFGFDSSQLASFYLSNESWGQGEEIALMHTPSEDPDTKSYAMSDTLLSDLISENEQKLLYVYDFIQMWCFYLEIIKIHPINSSTEYPICTTSLGDAPDQYSRMVNLNFDEETIDEDDIFTDDEMDEDEMYGEYDNAYDEEY